MAGEGQAAHSVELLSIPSCQSWLSTRALPPLSQCVNMSARPVAACGPVSTNPIKLLTIDILVLTTVKNAVKWDTMFGLQSSVNRRSFERKFCSWVGDHEHASLRYGTNDVSSSVWVYPHVPRVIVIADCDSSLPQGFATAVSERGPLMMKIKFEIFAHFPHAFYSIL